VAQRNLLVRVATSLVAAPVILGILLLGPPLAWYALVQAAIALAGVELFGMTHRGDRIAQILGIAMSLGVSAGLYFFTTDVRVLLSLLFGVILCGLLLAPWRLGEVNTAAGRMMGSVAGPLYIGALPTSLALMRRDLGSEGPRYVVLALLLAWLADTGGYFVGRRFGKAPLSLRLSPKKTVEGLGGAVLGSLFAALLAHFWFLPSLPLAHALVVGVVAGVIGQLGDLVESLLKRSTGVKDSGRIIPGHGGILDRIDALMMVAPVLYLYTLWK
jgi:phosphatidate cytidylyltransferase